MELQNQPLLIRGQHVGVVIAASGYHQEEKEQA
jgi:hypothetical protein